MAEVKTPRTAMLFIAILAPDPLLAEAETALGATFGSFDLRSRTFPFSFTDYYQVEMGPHLYRRFVASRIPIPQETLPEIKHRTIWIEKQISLLEEGRYRRSVNLDPGYLTPAKIVLASTKDYAHRIYLGQGIFGDLHLKYEQGAYQPLPWTYPDYRTQEALTFFAELRQIFLQD